MSIVDKVLTAIRGVPNIPEVFDGAVPKDPPLRYIVVYADEGVLSSATLAGETGLKDMDFQFRYVGATAGNVRDMQTLTRSVVIDKTFTDGGWAGTFDPDHYHVSGIPQPDESIPGRVVVTGFDNLTAQCRRVA